MNIIFENNDTDSVNLIKQKADKLFNTELNRTSNRFDEFDLIDDKNKYVIEVKKRGNNYSKYPTTMIGYNKYIKSRDYFKNGYKVMYFFIFTDGIYYFDYLGQEFIPKKGGRYDRGYNEIKNYIYINIKDLKKIDG